MLNINIINSFVNIIVNNIKEYQSYKKQSIMLKNKITI